VGELWDLLLEELQDVLLLVEVGEVVDADDEVLGWVFFLLLSDVELGGHDVLLHVSLFLELSVLVLLIFFVVEVVIFQIVISVAAKILLRRFDVVSVLIILPTD